VNIQLVKFEGIEGYATPERAEKRGQEVASQLPKEHPIRWLVIVLANGRFAPCFVVNGVYPGGPGMFLGLRNVCVVN
jgi:hypothetical protein